MNEKNPSQDNDSLTAHETEANAKVSRDFLVKAGIITEEPSEGGNSGSEREAEGSAAENPVQTASSEAPPTDQEAPNQPTPAAAQQRRVAKGYRRREEVADIARAAAVAAVEAIQKAKPEPAEREQAGSAEKSEANQEQQILNRLTDEERRLLDTFAAVEANNPDKYKNLRANAIKALDEYERLRSQWLSENPGRKHEDFDEDGSIMNSIESRYGLEVEEQDLMNAEVKSQIDPIKQELERTRRELEEAKAILAAERAKEEMQKAKESALQQVLNAVGIPKEKADEIMNRETLAAEALKREAEAVHNFVEAAYMSFAGLKHPLTNQVAELCQQYEQAISSMPPGEQTDSAGRTFINRAAYLQLPMQERMMIDNNTHPRFWGLNAELASVIGSQIIAERARKTYEDAIEKETKLLREHGVKTPPSYPQAQRNMQTRPQPAQPAPVAQPTNIIRKPHSPTSVNPVPGAAPSQQNADIPQGFVQRFLGKEPIGGGVTYEPSA